MAGSFGAIVLQILVPFVTGHLVRPWIGAWVRRSPRLTRGVDQGSILLVVYTAFSRGGRRRVVEADSPGGAGWTRAGRFSALGDRHGRDVDPGFSLPI